ncbi:adhesin HecA family 20-residue repeat (two copies) (3 repeats) [Proteus penneri ATCC 35198]|nr:adhesin HecA family 20-residue repeat (two copies) (3 repeats) [Proteus penneri ATCC 35198]
MVATDNLDLIAHQSLNNTHGLLEAGKTLKITTAGRWNNQEGITQAGHQIIASADTIDNTQGQLQSGDKLTFKTTHDVINTLGKITAQHLLQWQGHDNSQFNNNNGLLQSNGTLTLEGGALSNQQQGNIFSQKALQLVLKGDLLNQHGKITSNENSVIKANNLINTQGEINSLNTLNIDLLEQLDNRQGRLFSQSSQHLQATDILNTKGWMGSLDTWFAKASAFNNQTGQIQSQKEASLVANTFDNTNGLLQSSDSAQLRIAKSINNTQGKISAQNTVDAQGTQPNGAIETVNNIAGQWLAGNRLNLHVLNLDNSQHGLLYSQQHTQLAVDNALNNRQGKIQSEDNLALTAKTLYNQSGSIDGQQGVTLTLADLLDNSQGKIRSNQHQSIYGSRIQNHQGHISSQGELTVNGAQLDNTQGMLISQKNSHYDIEHINNNAGKIHSGQSLTLTATDLQNQQGQLVSTQALKVNTAQLDNHNNGILSSQDALNITTNTLNNRDNGLIWGTTQNVISAQKY